MRTERAMRTDRAPLITRFVARAARMAAFGAALGAVVSLVAVGRVRAQVSEMSRHTSGVVASLPELESGLTRLVVNGERVHVAAAVVPETVDVVTRAVESSCRADVAGLEGESTKKRDGQVPMVDALFNAMRTISSKHGETTTIFCIADNDAVAGRPLHERLRLFSDTHDLAALGSLRQFMLTTVDAGTRVIAVWLPGRFAVSAAFPEHGDAPGSDAPDAPRPDSSRRVLTALAEGHPHVVRIYDAGRADAEGVFRKLDADFVRRGWTSHVEANERLTGGAVYTLGDRDLLVQVRDDPRTRSVFVSTIEMSRPMPLDHHGRK